MNVEEYYNTLVLRHNLPKMKLEKHTTVYLIHHPDKWR